MNKKLKNESIDNLFLGILKLKNLEECYNFFEDLCTIHEIKSLAQRLDVARLLIKGATYTEIGQETGASTATISRVNRSLNYGCDWYELVFNRLKNEKIEEEREQK